MTIPNTLVQILSVEDIQKLIPHRYPMLLIDRLEIEIPGEKAVGIKNATMNEWFFQGHFPGKPVMPGVLIVEAMAQTAGAVVMHFLGGDHKNKIVYFMSIEEARFRKPVVPGDTLRIHVEKQQQRGPVWKFQASAYVGEQIVSESSFKAMIADEAE